MFTYRFFALFAAIALVVIAALTVREVFATTAVVRADRSYDAVEQVRAGHSEISLGADRSYDSIEQLRPDRTLSTLAEDHSYDAIENLRVQRLFK